MTSHSTAKRTEPAAFAYRHSTAVAAYPTRSDAELDQMVLWAAGIRYVIDPDLAGGSHTLDDTRAVRLLVEEADADDARSVLGDRPATRKERS